MRTAVLGTALLALLVACKEDRIRRDLTAYNDQLQARLDRAGEIQKALNEAARSANQGTDADFKAAGSAIASKVVPMAAEYVASLEAVKPETPEVAEIHAKLIAVARFQLDGVKAIAAALETADPAVVSEARKKLSSFKERLSEWQEQYLMLTKRYRVGAIVR